MCRAVGKGIESVRRWIGVWGGGGGGVFWRWGDVWSLGVWETEGGGQ